MKYTQSEANKLLKTLNETKAARINMLAKTSVFNAALGEDVESVRPDFEYGEFWGEICELNRKIRVLKHAINCFNTETIVPEFEMTIDQLLVYIPQLTEEKFHLEIMAQRLQKERTKLLGIGTNSVIDYTYANYDVEQAKADYEKVSEELAKAQTALDKINSTVEMEIDF